MASILDEAYYACQAPDGQIWDGQMELEPHAQQILLDALEELLPRRSRFERDGG